MTTESGAVQNDDDVLLATALREAEVVMPSSGPLAEVVTPGTVEHEPMAAPKGPPQGAQSGSRGRFQIPDDKPIWRIMLIFLVPLMMSNILQSVGQLASSIIVGRALGVNALATVSGFFPLFFLLVSFTIGIGSASSILIGQAYGAGNQEKLRNTVGTSVTFTFLLGVVLALLGGLFTQDILHAIGTPANVLAGTEAYAKIMFWALPVLFVYFAYTTFLRGTGDSKTPFYFLIISTVLNLILLPIFIFGWVGAPRMGVQGSAVATVVSTVVTLIALFVYLSKVKHPLRFDRDTARHLKIDTGILKLLIKIGIPSSIQMIMVSLSEIAVITFVNRFGSHATAAYGAVNQVASYVQMPAISLGIASSIFGAQMIGAGKFGRLQEIIRSAVSLNYLIGGVLVIVVYLFSGDVLSWFITSPGTLHTAHGLLMITLWSYLIFGNTSILSGMMRASGTVLWPTLIGVAAIWGVEVPVAYYLSHRTSLGIDGIWVGYPAAFIVSFALQSAYYLGVWKRRKVRQLAM